MQATIRVFTKKAAQEIAGSLTVTSKMPCKSYSLPMEECKTGAKLAKVAGSICSHCYAAKGFYAAYAATIKPAQYKRLDSISSPDWVPAMVALIGKDQFFRWHDSGDLQSLAHLEAIAKVATLTPNCKHWLPTRERGILSAYLRKHGALPANLIVRLSATFFDEAVGNPMPGINTATSHKAKAPIGFSCPAPTQGGACGTCRACWSKEVRNVSYCAH